MHSIQECIFLGDVQFSVTYALRDPLQKNPCLLVPSLLSPSRPPSVTRGPSLPTYCHATTSDSSLGPQTVNRTAFVSARVTAPPSVAIDSVWARWMLDAGPGWMLQPIRAEGVGRASLISGRSSGLGASGGPMGHHDLRPADVWRVEAKH